MNKSLKSLKKERKRKKSLELDKTYPNKGLEFDDHKREKKKKRSKKKEKYSGSKSESKENDDISICVEEDNKLDETLGRRKKKKLKDEQILEEFEERDVGKVQRKRKESLELDKNYPNKLGLEFDDHKREKKKKKSKKEKYSSSKSESKEHDDISICVEEENRDETSRRRKKKKLKDEQKLEEFEERDVGKVKCKQKESLELEKTYFKNGLEFDDPKRKKKKKKSKKKEKYSGSKSESKENDDISICVEEDNQDETSRRRKKKKLKYEQIIEEFEERDVGKVQRKQKKSLESENDDHQKKKKKKKSNKQENYSGSNTESKENDNASICHEKSFEKKPNRKRKERKLENIEATEKEQLPELPVAEKIKSKKVDKEHSKPGAKRGIVYECDAIHCDWHQSEEMKEKFKLRRGKWAKSEEKILTENMKIYLSENNLDDPSKLIFAHKHNDQSEERREWKLFAKATNFFRKLGRGVNRSLYSIYIKVLCHFDKGRFGGKFSESEDKELERLLALRGKKWGSIGRMMGRDRVAVHHRYIWIAGDLQGRWRDSEVHLLKEAVRKVSNTREGEEVFTNISWKAVASIVKTRNLLQCRQKWINGICWKDCKLSTWRKWGTAEELQLIKKVYESSVTEEVDIDWFELQKDFDMARSPGCLRAKFGIILKKYCNFAYLENTDFEDIIDYLYNVKSKELQDKCLGDLETNLE